MRALIVGTLVFALIGGLMATSASAAPSVGELTFDSVPLLAGAVSAAGAGEVPLDTNVPANLAGTGANLTLTRVRTTETVVAHPTGGGDLRFDIPDTESESVPFASGAFHLGATGATFRGLLFTGDEGRLSATAHHFDAAPLEAYRAPHLVVDDYDWNRAGEQGIFTYQADGDRFPVLLDQVAAQGDFTIFLYDADLVITGSDGQQVRYSSGASREEQQPGTFRVTHEHHLLHVGQGTATVTSDAVLAWLAAPTFTIDGTLKAATATGQVAVDDKPHTLQSVPVTMMGTFELRPEPLGEAEPFEPGDSQHVGTSQPSDGRYTASRGTFDGDITVLAVGNQQLVGSDSDLALAAAAGVVGITGVALLFVPNVKWALAGLIAPLYAKTQRDRLLDNASRDRIFQAIRNTPGINLSQIHRVVELGWGVTVYHLKMMEKNDLIVSESSARDRCFFENDPRLIELRQAIARIANREPVQRIVRSIVEQPGLNQGEVIAATGLTQRTVSYYLGRMSRSGLVHSKRVKNYVHYEPTDHLRRALDIVEASGVDEALPAETAVPVPA